MRNFILSLLMLFASSAAAQPPIDNMPLAQIDNMPLVVSKSRIRTAAPIPKRGISVRKYLSASVKIINPGNRGSGTICYYDREKNEAYVITCGHLWNGSYDSRNSQKRYCEVEVFYHNDVKLQEPRRYRAEIICYTAPNAGNDIGFIKFKPDWDIAEYYPIAPLDYSITNGDVFESCGCDHAKEVAAYTITIIGLQGDDLITRNNSPRPGRSGGGLLTPNGYYIGICWGTSNYDGSGIGYFVPLSRIHPYAQQHGLGWLLKVGKYRNIANELPIVEMTDPPAKYHKHYIPRP